jgi:hypothetical protein
MLWLQKGKTLNVVGNETERRGNTDSGAIRSRLVRVVQVAPSRRNIVIQKDEPALTRVIPSLENECLSRSRRLPTATAACVAPA